MSHFALSDTPGHYEADLFILCPIEPEYDDRETLVKPKGQASEYGHYELSGNNLHIGDLAGQRNIETQHKWLARLFRVKPIVEHICLTLSHNKARQETMTIFQEWQKYGIEDLEVNEERNVIFARVSRQNCKLENPISNQGLYGLVMVRTYSLRGR